MIDLSRSYDGEERKAVEDATEAFPDRLWGARCRVGGPDGPPFNCVLAFRVAPGESVPEVAAFASRASEVLGPLALAQWDGGTVGSLDPAYLNEDSGRLESADARCDGPPGIGAIDVIRLYLAGDPAMVTAVESDACVLQPASAEPPLNTYDTLESGFG